MICKFFWILNYKFNFKLEENFFPESRGGNMLNFVMNIKECGTVCTRYKSNDLYTSYTNKREKKMMSRYDIFGNYTIKC